MFERVIMIGLIERVFLRGLLWLVNREGVFKRVIMVG